MTDDVVHPGAGGVGLAGRDERPASVVSASTDADRQVPSQAPLAPAASTAARLRGDAMPPAASTGTDTTSNTASSSGRGPIVASPGAPPSLPRATIRSIPASSALRASAPL